MKKDENNSSLNSKIDLITFIGYREHLVMGFIRDNIIFNPSNIYIFTSKLPVIVNEESLPKNEVILNNVKEYIKNKNIKIKEMRVNNLWDIKYYYRKLNTLPKNSYIINISSGPGVYSSASMLWALNTDNQISYSVEVWENNKLRSSVFRNLNMYPFSFFNFKSDNLDKLIILAIEHGMTTTIEIKEYLMKYKLYATTLRSIQSHVHELTNYNVLKTDGNKPYRIYFSEEFKKLGYTSSDFSNKT